MKRKPKVNKSVIIITVGVVAMIAIALVLVVRASGGKENHNIAATPLPTASPAASATPVIINLGMVTISVVPATSTVSPPSISSPAAPAPTMPAHPPVASSPAPTPQSILAPTRVATSGTTPLATATPMQASPDTAPASEPPPPAALLAPVGEVIYQADFGSAANFSVNPIGEGEGELVARNNQLTCQAPLGGQGDGEMWIAPAQAVTVPSSATITVRFYSSGAAAGLSFDRSNTGAQLLYLSGTSASTYLSTMEWQQHSQYPGDGAFAAPVVAAQAASSYAGAWHIIVLQLTASAYQATVDGGLSASGPRSGQGGVALYTICDGVAFDTFTVTSGSN